MRRVQRFQPGIAEPRGRASRTDGEGLKLLTPYAREEETVLTRLVAAAAVLVSAAIHLWLWFDGYRDIEVIGPSFMLNAVAGVVIAVLLLVWRHWAPLLLAVGFGAATLGAFVTSTTVGLFGVNESWSGGYQLAAAVSEAVAIVAGIVAVWREGYLGRGQESPEVRSGRSSTD